MKVICNVHKKNVTMILKKQKQKCNKSNWKQSKIGCNVYLKTT